MYIAPIRGRQPIGDKNFTTTESPNHFAHLLQVFKKMLWSPILCTFFFHVSPYVYSPGQGETIHWGQNFGDSRKVFPLYPWVASFKMISSKSLFVHIFNDFINVYSCGARAENSLGKNFWCQQKTLITSTICCSNKSLWILILYTFFKVFPHVYSPRAGANNPLWTK